MFALKLGIPANTWLAAEVKLVKADFNPADDDNARVPLPIPDLFAMGWVVGSGIGDK